MKRKDENAPVKPRTVSEFVEEQIRNRKEGGPSQVPAEPVAENIASTALTAISTQPMPPNSVTIEIGATKIVLGTGLYLVTGGAGTGKSVISLGLAMAARKYGKLDAGHLYFFEHNAPTYKKRGEIRMFSDPRRFIDLGQESGDLVDHLSPWIKNRTARSEPAIVVLDSIGIPMRAFDAEGRRGQTAAEGGMQPADRVFVEHLDLLGTSRGIIFLGVVNSELVPFASKLYGAAQGLITAVSSRTFTKTDRAGARTGATTELPQDALLSALATMRYSKNKEQ